MFHAYRSQQRVWNPVPFISILVELEALLYRRRRLRLVPLLRQHKNMNRCWCWSPAARFSNILGKQQFLVRSNGSSGRCFSQQRQLVTDGGQGFDYLLVLDFEATCDKRGSTPIRPQVFFVISVF